MARPGKMPIITRLLLMTPRKGNVLSMTVKSRMNLVLGRILVTAISDQKIAKASMGL